MGKYSIIGKPVPPVESVPKVSGTLKYTTDIILPGMLYGKVLRSPYAHARIIYIDTSGAEKLPGVRAVITGQDIPRVKYGFVSGYEDEYALAIDKVRYVGEEVAAIAAITEEIAQEAIGLIKVTYEELPAVLNIKEAMKPGAPKIHDHAQNNIAFHIIHTAGNIEKGFQEADYIREDRFETPMVTHAFLAPRCCVADFNPATKELTLYSDGQMPFMGPLIANILNLPGDKVRVIRPYIAGAFGGRGGMADDVHVCAAFLSMRTGKPVKIEHTRAEEFATGRGREPLITEFKTGVKKDGSLVAMQCRHLTNSGAYISFSPGDALQNVGIFDLIFRVPNVKFEAYAVYTNTIPSTAVRGLTNTAFSFCQHSHMDMLARDLGMDVVDFYLKNVHQKGDITAAKYRLDSCGISECIQKVAKAIEWKKKRGNLPSNRGIGLGVGAHTAGFRMMGTDLSTAIVEIDEFGKARILSGRGDYGQGVSTMLAMCVAEELGLPVEDVSINEVVDTKHIPWECSNYGSRGTIQQGNAVILAARNVKQQLFQIVADTLEAPVEDLEAKNGQIFIKGSPEKSMSFREAVKAYRAAAKALPLIGRGHYDPPTVEFDPKTGEGNVSIAYGFGAQAVEVEVDTETGEVKILDVVTANDCGKVLNPLILEVVSQGGIVMGIGLALLEEIRHEKRGGVLNASFLHYGIPTALQSPKTTHIWVETLDPHGPYGAKGVAEVVTMPTAPAIANAIYDAIGVRIHRLPITPEAILDALENKNKEL